MFVYLVSMKRLVTKRDGVSSNLINTAMEKNLQY